MMFLAMEYECIFDDTITCIDGKCSECEYFLQREVKKLVQLTELRKQLNMFEDILNDKKDN